MQHDQWSPIQMNDTYALDHFNKSHESVLNSLEFKSEKKSVWISQITQFESEWFLTCSLHLSLSSVYLV